ncbi:hypothetical protein ACPESR_17060 [Nocardia testacea]|uniref:hypothetical protein n=1 Tax=Nocardia testacea TaxID=248551 RepID=UPI003C2B1CC4
MGLDLCLVGSVHGPVVVDAETRFYCVVGLAAEYAAKRSQVGCRVLDDPWHVRDFVVDATGLVVVFGYALVRCVVGGSLPMGSGIGEIVAGAVDGLHRLLVDVVQSVGPVVHGCEIPALQLGFEIFINSAQA